MDCLPVRQAGGLWTVLLAMACPAFAQFAPLPGSINGYIAPAAGVSSFAPTNEPAGSGANLISWWRGDYITTNSSVQTLPDLGGVHTYSLTNQAAKTTWPVPQTGGTLTFDGSSQYLQCYKYYAAGPHELVLAIKVEQQYPSGSSAFLYDSATNSSARNTAQILTNGKWELGTGADSTGVAQTNAWLVFDALHNTGTSGQIWTNTVDASGTLTLTSSAEDSLAIGCRYGQTSSRFLKFELAEAVTYSAALSTASRSNLYYYFKHWSPVSSNLGLP